MLRRADTITGVRVAAQDGDIGTVGDLYFSDDSWSIRYIVVDTGPWLFGRRVLISPQAARETPFDGEAFHVNLTTEQVERSPEIDLDKPVSRQNETAIHQHYSWGYYWLAVPNSAGYGKSGVSGGAAGVGAPVPVASGPEDSRAEAMAETADQVNTTLRSINEVVGYHIAANDGEIGHVEDFFVDDKAWVIRYMLVDTRNWLPGRKVLVSPEWIGRVSWRESIVSVDVTRKEVEDSPEYRDQREGPLDRAYEARLFQHYGAPFYWF